ncbi:MAG: beta-lactamase family protein, partial [Bacteroidia bacterium]|nr:beta-lactamase family protein [Bacteroidia bacterium]
EGIQIKHLLDMTSGLEARWKVLNPFDHLAESYYGTDLKKLVTKIKKVYPPGEVFQYNNLNTVLLAMVLEKVTGMTVTQYLQEKIWNPLGMESEALWLTDNQDSTGIEKAFCCLHATARDFAKYGRLYLHNGNWNGKQIIPCAWIDRILNLESKQWDYQMHTAILDTEPLTFAFRGLYNQNIFINPSRELIVVTMNPAKRKDNPLLWENIFKQISLVIGKN